MRLTFLGTGPATAIPRPGHRDAACADARRGGRSRRTRSAVLVETQNAAVLIDAGPDIARQLERERVRCVDLVLLTHGHADACGGLRLLDRWLARRTPARIVPVFTDRATKRRLEEKYKRLACLRLIAVQPFGLVTVGRLRVTPFPVRHATGARERRGHAATPGFPTFGWSFGRSLAYASDLFALPPRSAKLIKNVETLVLDAAAWFGIRIPTHLSTDAAIRLAGELRARHAVLTQIGHAYPPHGAAKKALRHYVTVLRDPKPRRVTLAYDGLRINK